MDFFDKMTKEELRGYLKIHLFLQDSKYYTARRKNKLEVHYDHLTLIERLRLILHLVKVILFDIKEDSHEGD